MRRTGLLLLRLLLLLTSGTGRWNNGGSSRSTGCVHLLVHWLLALGGRRWSDLGGRFAGRGLHRRWRWRLSLSGNSSLVNYVHATDSSTGQHVCSKRVSHPGGGHVHVRHPVDRRRRSSHRGHPSGYLLVAPKRSSRASHLVDLVSHATDVVLQQLTHSRLVHVSARYPRHVLPRLTGHS